MPALKSREDLWWFRGRDWRDRGYTAVPKGHIFDHWDEETFEAVALCGFRVSYVLTSSPRALLRKTAPRVAERCVKCVKRAGMTTLKPPRGPKP